MSLINSYSLKIFHHSFQIYLAFPSICTFISFPIFFFRALAFFQFSFSSTAFMCVLSRAPFHRSLISLNFGKSAEKWAVKGDTNVNLFVNVDGIATQVGRILLCGSGRMCTCHHAATHPQGAPRARRRPSGHWYLYHRHHVQDDVSCVLVPPRSLMICLILLQILIQLVCM